MTKCKTATLFALVSCVASSSSTHQVHAAEECEDVSSYYSSIVSSFTSTSGTTLRDSLRARISSPYTTYPYSSSSYDARDALEVLDKTSDCCVTELYTRDTSPISSADWNREHVWPKSLGLGTSGSDYSDIHNLRAADMNVNSARGNLVFGDCPGCDVGHAEAPLTKKNSVVFEPPDEVKGDVARIIFYMYTRYTGLLLSDNPSGDSEMGRLNDLLEWHAQDPVSAAELARNDGACKLQLNRNPFVDYPCLVGQIFGEGVAACGDANVPTKQPVVAPVGGPPSSQSSNVIISTYLEGSSNTKAIQVRNIGTSTASLDAYVIRIFFNGATSSSVVAFPSGTTLSAGETFTMCNPSISTESFCDSTGTITMNGDDAVALTSSSDDSVVYDIVGTIGVRPSNGGFTACTTDGATKDHTLVRAEGATGNSGQWEGNNGCSDWTVNAVDTFEQTASAAVCETEPAGWFDADGSTYDCTWYAAESRCSEYGNGYANNGVTANMACCECGGGSVQSSSERDTSPAELKSAADTTSPGMSPAALGGTVVGGLAAVVASVFAVFQQRKNQQKQQTVPEAEMSSACPTRVSMSL